MVVLEATMSFLKSTGHHSYGLILYILLLAERKVSCTVHLLLWPTLHSCGIGLLRSFPKDPLYIALAIWINDQYFVLTTMVQNVPERPTLPPNAGINVGFG